MSNKRYWAIRTDKYNRDLLYKELCQGQLRQGWGYNENQDLFKIQKEIDKGNEWWDRLSEEQKEALPHLRMLSDSEDSIQIGDIILAPNLPEHNLFCLAEVTGKYYYQMLKLGDETDVNELGNDYGHVLPVRLLTPSGIEKFNQSVHAELRSTLRAPMRMWNLDAYSEHIEKILLSFAEGDDLHTPFSGEARLNIAWENAMSKAKQTLRENLSSQLSSQFQAAEWEEPIKNVLSQLYPGVKVRWTGGANEQGADIILQIPNHFETLPWLIVIQVKNYSGEIDEAVLKQIRQAYEHYSKEGKILLGVVMTTAERKSSRFDIKRKETEQEIGIPIKLILRKKLIEIMTEGLSTDLK